MRKVRPVTRAAVRDRAYEVALDLLSGEVRPTHFRYLKRGQRQRLGMQLAAIDRWHRAGWINGFGLGPKVVLGRLTDAIACRIYVRGKRPSSRLRPSERIPEAMALEGFDEPILLDVIERPMAELSLLTDPHRPVFPGISAGHCASGDTGTIGALCRLVGEQGTFLLGASHVLAVSGLAKKDDPIIQPGVEHGGSCPSFTIGHLFDHIPLAPTSSFQNRADAALARLAPGVPERLDVFPIARAAQRQEIRPGTLVNKLGCITGPRLGTISELHHRCRFTHRIKGGGEASLGFTEQILYQASSAEGDSGGPLVADGNILVGIHIGRCGHDAVATPIWNILERWNLQF